MHLCKVMHACGTNRGFAVAFTSASHDEGQMRTHMYCNPLADQGSSGGALKTISGNHRVPPIQISCVREIVTESLLNSPHISNCSSAFARATLLAAAIVVDVHLYEKNGKSVVIPEALQGSVCRSRIII